MTHYYTLEKAKKYKSRSKPYPFIIAQECREPYTDKVSGEQKVKKQKYFAFEDVQHFLDTRDEHPHAHEVIFNRIDDNQQGRLVIDFDFDKPWNGVKPNFVPADFEDKMEFYITKVAKNYYKNIDVTKFVFVWLVSDVDTKWSKHLIVKNLCFGEDWKSQSFIFYNLLLYCVEQEKPFSISTSKLIDQQVVRSNASMRMLGSAKYGKSHYLEIEKPKDVNFYDTLVQLYRVEDIRAEQKVYSEDLDMEKISKFSNTKLKTSVYVLDVQEETNIFKNINFVTHEIEDETQKWAMEVFEEYDKEHGTGEETPPYVFQSYKKGDMILARTRPSKCMISGKYHEQDHAYIRVIEGKVYFYCRRKCKTKKNRKGLLIGIKDEEDCLVKINF